MNIVRLVKFEVIISVIVIILAILRNIDEPISRMYIAPYQINPFLLNLQKINYWLIQESEDINPRRPEAFLELKRSKQKTNIFLHF